MSCYILPIHCATSTAVDKSFLTARTDVGQSVPVPHTMWIVKGDAGIIAMDTGPGHDSELLRSRGIEAAESLPSAVAANAGIALDEVETVVVSHLHWDHCTALDLFPNARFVVRNHELQAAIAPPDLFSRTYGYGDRVPPMWLRYRDRFDAIDEEQEIMPGVRVVDLPGHSPGLIGLLVATGHGDVLLASDACPLYENWLERIPPGTFWDIEACYRSFAKMASLGAKIIPSHDFAVYDDPEVSRLWV